MACAARRTSWAQRVAFFLTVLKIEVLAAYVQNIQNGRIAMRPYNEFFLSSSGPESVLRNVNE